MKTSDELLEDYKRAIRDGKVEFTPGTAARAEGQVPWQESFAPGRGIGEALPSNPEEFRGAFDVTPHARRTAQQRLEHATELIYGEAMKSYQAHGRVIFAPSVLKDIQDAFWAAGEPITLAQIETLAADQIRPLCERYAAKLLSRVQRKYPGNDRRFLTPVIKGA